MIIRDIKLYRGGRHKYTANGVGVSHSAVMAMLDKDMQPGEICNVKVVELDIKDKALIRDLASSLKSAALNNADMLLGSAIRGNPPGLAANANAVCKSERWRDHAKLYEMMLALAEICE